MEVFPIKISKKSKEFDLFKTIIDSNFKFQEKDILIISSKFVSISEGSLIDLNDVQSTKRAKTFASRFQMDEKIAEIVLRESDSIISGIPGFLLSIKNGIIAPNAGIDKSNAPPGKIILYPKDSFNTATMLRQQFFQNNRIKVGIVICDSRLMPTRIGNTGIAIGVSGFEPVEDQRGKEDLFGRKLTVTFKATADCLATIGVFLMGEGGESIPIIVVRRANVIMTNRHLCKKDLTVKPNVDIYLRNFQAINTQD